MFFNKKPKVKEPAPTRSYLIQYLNTDGNEVYRRIETGSPNLTQEMILDYLQSIYANKTCIIDVKRIGADTLDFTPTPFHKIIVTEIKSEP